MLKFIHSISFCAIALIICLSFVMCGCMGGGSTAPTPAPTVAATSETGTTGTETGTTGTETGTTEGTTSNITDIMAKAEEHGDTPEVKYGNAIFLAYMLTARELTVAGTDMQKNPGDLAKVKEICTASDKNFEEIKKAVDGLTAPKGYETCKEGFMSFLTKTQEAMKALGEAKDEKQAKEIETKLGEATTLGQEVLVNLEKSGYKPTETFQKYVQETFMGGTDSGTVEGTTEGTTEGGATTETTETTETGK
jgi:hypothetical protein